METKCSSFPLKSTEKINNIQKIPIIYGNLKCFLVAGGGIEPPTFRLWAWRATTALPRDKHLYFIKKLIKSILIENPLCYLFFYFFFKICKTNFGANGWSRTADHRVMSPVLYRWATLASEGILGIF